LLQGIIPELKPRSKTLNDLAEGSTFLFRTRPLTLDERAAKLLEGDGRTLLEQVRHALAAVPAWEAATLDAAVRALAEAQSVGLGKLAQPLRAALTGQTTSPGIFDVLLALGRDESMGRIDDLLASVPADAAENITGKM
jgi:glutamyl-tRNA synthetase